VHAVEIAEDTARPEESDGYCDRRNTLSSDFDDRHAPPSAVSASNSHTSEYEVDFAMDGQITSVPEAAQRAGYLPV